MIAFFSASKNQFSYFEKLAIHKQNKTKHLFYKNISWTYSTCFRFNKRLIDIVTKDLARRQSGKGAAKRAAIKITAIFRFIEAIFLYSKYYQCIKKNLPSKSVVWNGLKFRQKIWCSACNELLVPIIYMENGLIKNMTTIDPKGVNYNNSVPREPSYYLKNNYKYTPQLENSVNKKIRKSYIFLPLQIDSDSQISEFSPWIKNMKELLLLVNSLHEFSKENNLLFIVKPHPLSYFNYDNIYNKLNSHIKIDKNTNTETLIGQANIVITINSTVGLEATLLKIPTIVLGQAFYTIQGLAKQAKNKEELINLLKNPPQINNKIHHNFHQYLINEYQVKGDWREASEEHIKSAWKRIDEL